MSLLNQAHSQAQMEEADCELVVPNIVNNPNSAEGQEFISRLLSSPFSDEEIDWDQSPSQPISESPIPTPIAQSTPIVNTAPIVANGFRSIVMEQQQQQQQQQLHHHQHMDTSSDTSPTSSPFVMMNEPQQQQPIFENQRLDVALLHKPRGSHGMWLRVESGNRLRVTKGKGKRLKLSVVPPAECRQDVQVTLLDTQDGQAPTSVLDGFAVSSTKLVDNAIELDMKLTKTGKKLQFVVRAESVNGDILTGHSIFFEASNSGMPPGGKESGVPPSPSFDRVPQMVQQQQQQHAIKRQLSESLEDMPNTSATEIQGNLEVKGVVRAKAFTQFSDIRLKTNVKDIVDALDLVTQLQGKTYEWKQDFAEEYGMEGGRRVVGLIAQEVQRVLPEVVREDPQTGILSVAYQEILPVLIEAFKEFIGNYAQDKAEFNEQLQELRDKIDEVEEELQNSQKRDRKEEFSKMLTHLTSSSRNIFQMYQEGKRSGAIPYGVSLSPNDSQEVLEFPSNSNTDKFSGKHVQKNQFLFGGGFALSLAMLIGGIVLAVASAPTDAVVNDVAARQGRFAAGIVIAIVGIIFLTLSTAGMFFCTGTKFSVEQNGRNLNRSWFDSSEVDFPQHRTV